MDILTVILEVDGHDRLSGVVTADPADSLNHVLALFRCQKKIRACSASDRHVMEVPEHLAALLDQHVQELVAGDDLVVDGSVADGCPEQALVLLHQIHRMHDLVEGSLAATAVIRLLKALDGDVGADIPDTNHLLAELLIDQRSVRVEQEIAVLEFLCKADNILLAHHRLPAGHDISMDAKLTSLLYNALKLLIRQSERMAILCRPAACAAEVARGSRIHQDDPRYIAIVLFCHLAGLLITTDTCLIADIHRQRLHLLRCNIIEQTADVLVPLCVGGRDGIAHSVISRRIPGVPDELLGKIDELHHRLLSVLVCMLDRSIYKKLDPLTLCFVRK